MNVTKRKFNALLNGIGNKPSSSLLPKDVNNERPTTADSQVKKRRVLPAKTTSLAQEGALGHKKSASTTATAPTETPKYAPWDRVAFLERLKTFSNLTDWTAKPAKVNEVEWAKRGWVCQKAERVRCCLCNVEILVKLNQKEVDGVEQPVYIAHNIEDALVERYVDLIVTSHDEGCLWRQRGCDDSIFKLPLNSTPIALEGLRTRYNQLCTRKDTLPYIFNLRLPQDFDLDVVLGYLSPDFFAVKSTNVPEAHTSSPIINKIAFQMALFGWQGHTHERLGAQLGSVSCHACFRVLGLWLFKSKKVSEAGEEIEGASLNGLDLVNEHRIYCPWRNAASQNGTNSRSTTATLTGWEIMLRVLKNDYHLKHSEDRPTVKPRPDSSRDELSNPFGDGDEDDDARSIREEKEKERWARLRRVKSLFNTKEGRKSIGTSREDKRKSGA